MQKRHIEYTRRIPVAWLLLLIGMGQAPARAESPEGAPRLRKQGTATQLVVDGRPFLVLGGELHNSSSSSLEYMRPIWQRLVDMHFNTVLAPVSWELVEPA